MNGTSTISGGVSHARFGVEPATDDVGRRRPDRGEG